MKIHEPPMTFASPEAEAIWKKSLENNQEPYGFAVYRFASEWATRMETAILKGEAIKDCAERLCKEADDEGITGFMYGAAVSILAGCWKWGEELRRWHNLDIQLGHEGERANETGGVLNPALLRVVKK